MSELLNYFDNRQDDMLATLRAMVETESFTRDKAGVDRMIDLMQSHFTRLQADAIERFPQGGIRRFLARDLEQAGARQTLPLPGAR